MALGSNPYRKVFIDDMAKLQDLSVLAERAYIHLAFGQRSTACCLVRIKPDALRLELREHSRAKVAAALDELEAAGWVSIDRQTWTIALPLQSQRTPSENASVSQGKWKEAQKFPPSRQRDEVLDTIAQELARWETQSGHRVKDSGETVTRTSNSNRSRNSISSVAKATDTPAVASMAPAVAMEDEEPPPFDWSTIAPTPDPYLDPSYRPEPKLTPEAQARIDRLKAEQAQQTLTLTAPKTVKRELTPGQLDAIFAKRKLREVVEYWNEVMAEDNAPCDYKTVEKMAGTLMSNFAKYKHRDLFDDARCLFGWAMAIDRYHSGRDTKKWSFQQWLTAEHLSLVFAAYRAHKGDAKMLTMDLDRTLRDWRLEVEAGELNNKLAAQNEAA